MMKRKTLFAIGIICALASIALIWPTRATPGDSPNDPIYIPIGGGTYPGTINTVGTSKWYNFTGYIGHVINIILTMDSTADYDIYLWLIGVQIGFSKNVTLGAPENILTICPADGNYSIQVYLCAGYGNYTLYVDPIDYEPNIPSAPSGPSTAYVYTDYTFSAVTTDIENDNLTYTFDWGDNTTTTTAFYQSNTTAYASHQWTKPITYNIKVKAQDNHGRWSNYSTTSSITLGPNDDGLGTDAANHPSYAHYLNYSSYYNTTYTSNGTLYMGDPKDEDFINFTAAAGEYIKVTMTPIAGVDFDLKLIAPNGNYWISKNAAEQTETIEITNATVGGNYSIDVYTISGEGFYNFTVNVSPSRIWLTIQVSDSPSAGVKIWVDGTQYNGTTTTNPLHILVFRGNHTIQAQSYFRIGYGKYAPYYYFDYWSDNGSTANPRNIYITEDFTTMAVYYEDWPYIP